MTRGTVQRDKVYVYGSCEVCADESNVLVYERDEKLLCAEHTTIWSRKNPIKQLCDICDSDAGVFRDPSHRRNEYLCFSCHVKNGFVPRDTVTLNAIKNVLSQEKS
jgi:hypothetical protein